MAVRMRITAIISSVLSGILFVGACTSEVATTPPRQTPTPELSTPITAPTTQVPASPPPAIPTTAPTPTATPVPDLPELGPAPQLWPGPNEVWLWADEYRPSVLHVPVGTTVTWTEKDGAPHDVESKTGLFMGTLAPGVSFQYTFAERGTFYYHCECGGMEGVIIVE